MTDAVMISMISLLGTVIGTFSGILTSYKLISYRIEQLEKKVEKHNNVVERVFRLEDNDRLFEEKISVINHIISKLEKKDNESRGA